MTELKIALDYDSTYDADPKLWNSFIASCKTNGHTIFLLTYRDERYDKTPLLIELEDYIPVYYTRGVAKRWWAEQFGPGKIDIWIDDRPESILDNSKFSPEALAEWRVGDREKHYPS